MDYSKVSMKDAAITRHVRKPLLPTRSPAIDAAWDAFFAGHTDEVAVPSQPVNRKPRSKGGNR